MPLRHLMVMCLGCFYCTASVLLDEFLYIFLEGRSPCATLINTRAPPAVFSSVKQWCVPVLSLILHLTDEVSDISWIGCGGSDGVHGSLIHPTDALEVIRLYISLLQLTQVIMLFRSRNMLHSTRLKTLLAQRSFAIYWCARHSNDNNTKMLF